MNNMNNKIELNANPVVTFLKKVPEEFTKADIISYIKENGTEMVNFMYPAMRRSNRLPGFLPRLATSHIEEYQLHRL